MVRPTDMSAKDDECSPSSVRDLARSYRPQFMTNKLCCSINEYITCPACAAIFCEECWLVDGEHEDSDRNLRCPITKEPIVWGGRDFDYVLEVKRNEPTTIVP